MGTSLWTSRDKAPCQFPWLDKDEYCDVAIIGGGIAAAMCARRFAEAGISTVVVSSNPVGFGATAASMGVISYQAQEGLTGLSKKTDMDTAVKVFELCAGAVDALEELCSSLGEDVGFLKRDCLYYTDNSAEVQNMKQEYLARRHNGFAVELLDSNTAKNMFSFNIESAVYSPGMAAQCDPYLLTHAILAEASNKGARIYENTNVDEIVKENGENALVCCTDKTIHAKKVILAAGLETAKDFSAITLSRTTFNVATEPVGDFAGWHNEMVIVSEGKSPIKLRTTPDHRIIISGLECGMTGALKIAGALKMQSFYNKKYTELTDKLISMFPGIRGITGAYTYAVSHVCTADGLPIIGPSKADESICYAVCPAENGIAYASIAADMLIAHHNGETNPDMYLFSPDR